MTDERQAFADYLAGVEKRMRLFLGRVGEHSYAEHRLSITKDEIAELSRLFEAQARK
jgi:hypothetical protein